NDPPTPIKSGVAINRGANERGFGLTFTGTPVSPLYLEASYGRLYTHGTVAQATGFIKFLREALAFYDSARAGVFEWEGKGRYSLSSTWTFEAKLNHMLQRNIELHVRDRVTTKPTVLVNWVSGHHTVAFEGEYNLVAETRDDEQPGHQDYRETMLSLSYGYGANLLFTVGWQGVDQKLTRRYADQTSWPIFETVWSITERNVLRVRIGAEKGGYTCSGGVCRFEAPFRGVKAQLITRF
ncbi:MAG: DUF6029 family protein, partial [candidate division WOR-3 bacterium]